MPMVFWCWRRKWFMKGDPQMSGKWKFGNPNFHISSSAGYVQISASVGW